MIGAFCLRAYLKQEVDKLRVGEFSGPMKRLRTVAVVCKYEIWLKLQRILHSLLVSQSGGNENVRLCAVIRQKLRRLAVLASGGEPKG